jgi:hypothetical protein
MPKRNKEELYNEDKLNRKPIVTVAVGSEKILEQLHQWYDSYIANNYCQKYNRRAFIFPKNNDFAIENVKTISHLAVQSQTNFETRIIKMANGYNDNSIKFIKKSLLIFHEKASCFFDKSFKENFLNESNTNDYLFYYSNIDNIPECILSNASIIRIHAFDKLDFDQTRISEIIGKDLYLKLVFIMYLVQQNQKNIETYISSFENENDIDNKELKQYKGYCININMNKKTINPKPQNINLFEFANQFFTYINQPQSEEAINQFIDNL